MTIFKSEAIRINKNGEIGFLSHKTGINFINARSLGEDDLKVDEEDFTIDSVNKYISNVSRYSMNGCPFKLSKTQFNKIKNLLKED